MSVNVRQTALAVGIVDQADLVTANSNAELFRLTKTNAQIAEVGYNVEDDAGDIGKDDEFAANTFLSHKDTRFSLEAYLTSEHAAFAFAYGLGLSTDSAPEAGAYRHTATPIVSTIDMPSFTLLERIPASGTAVLDRALLGCVVDSWAIALNSGPGRQNSRITIGCVGTGQETLPSGLTLPAATALHGLNAGSATIVINGNNYISSKRIVSLEMGFNNNMRLDQGFYPGSGTDDGFAIRGRMEHGDRTAFLRFVVRSEQGGDEFTKTIAQTEGTAVVTVTGAIAAGATAHDLSVTFHRVTFKTTTLADDNGILTTNVECAVLKHSTNGLITAYATNTIPLVGAET